METIEDFLGNLTADELREVAIFSGVEKLSAPRKRDLIERIIAAQPASEIASVAERVEALRGFKHIWLLQMRETPDLIVDDLAQSLWPDSPGTYEALTSHDEQLQPTVQFVEPWSECVYVKFTHWVQSDSWELVEPTRKELVSSRIRHPIVAVIHARTGVVELRFNGFTQGAGTPKHQRIAYDSVVAQAAELIGERLGVEVEGLRLSEAIAELLQGRAHEVQDVRRVVKPGFGGRIVLDTASTSTDMDVPALMSKFFEQVAIQYDASLNEKIRAALANSPAESLLLAWTKPGVFTRVAFYTIAPELLFIWRGEERTVDTIDYVVSTLISHVRFGASDRKAALAAIDSTPAGYLIRASDLADRFHLSATEVYELFEESRRREWVEPQFRVRTDKLLENMENNWSSSLGKLPEVVRDEDGMLIDTLDPKNIEVGFRRVGDR